MKRDEIVRTIESAIAFKESVDKHPNSIEFKGDNIGRVINIISIVDKEDGFVMGIGFDIRNDMNYVIVEAINDDDVIVRNFDLVGAYADGLINHLMHIQKCGETLCGDYAFIA